MAPLRLLCEGNAGRSEVQGHNNICIRSEKTKVMVLDYEKIYSLIR